MTYWFSCAGSLPTFTAGTSSSPLTPPPPPRVLVELHHSGHPNPRHVVAQNPRELLRPFLPLDLAAGDHRRRSTAAILLLYFGFQSRDVGLEGIEVQGVFYKALDSEK
jgi:hypothetical protein